MGLTLKRLSVRLVFSSLSQTAPSFSRSSFSDVRSISVFTWHRPSFLVDKMMLPCSGLVTGVSYFPRRISKHFAFCRDMNSMLNIIQHSHPGTKDKLQGAAARGHRGQRCLRQARGTQAFFPEYLCSQCCPNNMTLPVTQQEKDAALLLGTTSSFQL